METMTGREKKQPVKFHWTHSVGLCFISVRVYRNVRGNGSNQVLEPARFAQDDITEKVITTEQHRGE